MYPLQDGKVVSSDSQMTKVGLGESDLVICPVLLRTSGWAAQLRGLGGLWWGCCTCLVGLGRPCLEASLWFPHLFHGARFLSSCLGNKSTLHSHYSEVTAPQASEGQESTTDRPLREWGWCSRLVKQAPPIQSVF